MWLGFCVREDFIEYSRTLLSVCAGDDGVTSFLDQGKPTQGKAGDVSEGELCVSTLFIFTVVL